MATLEKSCMVDPDAIIFGGECVVIHPEALVGDTADAESLAFTGTAWHPLGIEDSEDIKMESQFVAAMEDLQDSSRAKTADSRPFCQEQFVDTNGNLHGYAEFPAEKIIPSQSILTCHITPFVDDSYIFPTSDDIFKMNVGGSHGSNHAPPPNNKWRILPLDNDEHDPVSRQGGKRHLSPYSKDMGNDSRHKIARTDALMPETDVNLALLEESHILGVNEANTCSSEAEITMIDDVMYTPLRDSLGSTLQYELSADNEELLNAGQNHLIQLLDESTSSEAFCTPLPLEVKELLESRYFKKWDSRRASETSVADSNYSNYFASQWHDSLDLAHLNEENVFDDILGFGVEPVKSDDPQNEYDSLRRFERSFSPPILCRLKHGKKTRVVHLEISDHEFEELLTSYGGPDIQSGCPSDTLTSDYDSNNHDLSDDDDEGYFCANGVQDTQLYNDQSIGISSALGNHPNSSLLTSAVSDAGDIISSHRSIDLASEHQSTADSTSTTTSTFNTLPSSANANIDVQYMLLPSMPASTAVGDRLQAIHVPPPTRPPQTPTTDRRQDPVGNRQAEAYGEDSDFIVYVPGNEFIPVQVTPRKHRLWPRPKTTTPPTFTTCNGERNSDRNVTPLAQNPIVAASISTAANPKGHQSLSSIPVFISDCESNSAGFGCLSPGRTSPATKSIAAATEIKHEQLLSSIPVFTSDRESSNDNCHSHSQIRASPATNTMAAAADANQNQPLSSIPVLVGISPPGRDSGMIDANLASPNNFEGYQPRKFSRKTSDQDLVSNFITPKKPTRRGRRAADGKRALARRDYKGQGYVSDQGQIGGQIVTTASHESRQDNSQASSSNAFNTPRSVNFQQSHWQQPLPTFNPPWNQLTASSSRAHMSPICPSPNTTTLNGTAMTPSAFFSPFPSYNPPTPTPLFRRGQNPAAACPLSARPPPFLPVHHLSQRRTTTFLHPPHSPEISESPIPFHALQPSLSSTSSRRPREIATVGFHNSQTRDLCMEMFEKEKMKSEKGRQLMVTENMEGSNRLIISGPVGANVRGFVQALFGPSVEINVVLS